MDFQTAHVQTERCGRHEPRSITAPDTAHAEGRSARIRDREGRNAAPHHYGIRSSEGRSSDASVDSGRLADGTAFGLARAIWLVRGMTGARRRHRGWDDTGALMFA